MSDYWKNELPEYRSHKIVRAAVIVGLPVPGEDGHSSLQIANIIGAESQVVNVPNEVFKRGTPALHDYLIVYPDGYISWSPAASFQDGYNLSALTTVVEAKTHGDIINRTSDILKECGENHIANDLVLWLGLHSCLMKAALDEPVFILRAQDRLAPRLVMKWAERAKRRGAGKAKYRGARRIAKQMWRWHDRRNPT